MLIVEIVENVILKKQQQIIAVENVNKLSSKHSFHSANDEESDILSEKRGGQKKKKKGRKEWAKKLTSRSEM